MEKEESENCVREGKKIKMSEVILGSAISELEEDTEKEKWELIRVAEGKKDL